MNYLAVFLGVLTGTLLGKFLSYIFEDTKHDRNNKH